jgi:thiol-disulfide isomerase/thioredoxin
MPNTTHFVKAGRLLGLWVLVAVLPAWGAGPGAPDTRPVDLTARDLEGRTHRLSEYRGRWVVVNFWATWCPPCLEEIPELSLFQEKYRHQGVVVIGVNLEDINTERLKGFVDAQFIDYPVWRMRPAYHTPLGRIVGLPTTFIVSPQGQVTGVHVGAVTGDQLERYITPLGAQALGR